MPPPQFKIVLDSIIWGFKHVIRDIADLGLSICLEILNNLASLDPAVAGPYWQSYYLLILQDVFFVLTDTHHKSSFKLQCQLMARIFNLVESNTISAPLWPQNGISNYLNNAAFLKDHVLNLLGTAFPHLTR